MATDKLQIIIMLKDRFTRGMNAVGKTLQKVRSSVGKLKEAFFGLKTAILAMGATAIAYSFTAVAMSFQKFETILKTITGSAAKARESMAWISNFAATTPYELGQITDAFVKLKSYGFDPTTGVLKALGDTAAGMGKGLIQAVEMFADAATGEFERLKEFGIRAEKAGDEVTFSWMENGVQMTKTSKKIQTEITKTLEGILSEKYSGAMDALSKTFGGMWSNIQDHFVQFQQTVMSSGVFTYMNAALSLVLENINKLKEEGKLDLWAEEIGERVVSSFKFMVFGVISAYEIFAPIMSKFKILFSSIWDWFKDLPPWVQTSGLVLAIMGGRNVKLTLLALGAMGKGIGYVKDDIRVLTQEFDKGKSALWNYNLLLESLQIQKKRLSKAPFFGKEDDEEFRKRIDALKEIEEQIESVKSKISQLTPIKIFGDGEEEIDGMSAIRAAAIKMFTDIEKKRKEDVARMAAEDAALAKKQKDKLPPPKKPPAPEKIVDLSRQVKEGMLALEVAYKQGKIKLLDYLEFRKKYILKALSIEIDKIQDEVQAEASKITKIKEALATKPNKLIKEILEKRLAAAEQDTAKREELEHQLFVKKQEYTLKEIELIESITQAHSDSALEKISIQTELTDILRDLSQRAIAPGAGTDLEAGHAEELAELDRRQQEEMQRIMDLTEFMENEQEKRAAIDQAFRDQTLEKDKLLAYQQRQLMIQRLTNAETIAGGLADIFQDMYELGGKESKKMFELQKKMAMAEAIISTAKAVAGALGTPPYGLAAMANAAIIAIKGGLQVAKIKAQEMAEGGLVSGHSLHSKADNISIKGTAGEFMQPVSAVKHLGLRVMEGIRQNVFPKELFDGFKLPAFARTSSGSGYAEGGVVNGGDSNFSVSVPVNINEGRAAGIAGMLQNEVEETVIRVMERELR